ncbi:fatty acyl-AMP ligase [Actinomadura sp. KC216]|uniref:fatty acyl-AMP ligase n=1 Tax=Actinomadura sp. KC216 TaxID=2530370 RepID=UPI001049675E|nr:fatty acyl-AMP ligase [Actinomadura sp. KC216]TDB91907.1 fatty acyl-AMP ligase [Actinomadura sp. KC216]
MTISLEASDVDLSESMVDVLRRLARHDPAAPAFTFVEFAGGRRSEAAALTFGELDLRARAVAAELQALTVPGDRVALLLPQDASYVVAFFGCLYAGVLAVPLFPPDGRQGDRLRSVLADCGPRYVLSTVAGRGTVDAFLDEFPDHTVQQVIPVDEIPAGVAEQWRAPEVALDQVAYLQYTSGSTSRPAGVRVTHRNIVTACWQTRSRGEFSGHGVVVSWLPFFHDLGLVVGLLMPASVGAHAVHLTAWAFVQDPRRWLDVITRYRGTYTAAPNFALDLCVRRVTGDRREGLDLSSLKDLLSGGEQVRPASMAEFEAAFAGCGLPEHTQAAGYGLAEATLGVTSSTPVKGRIIGHFDRAALGRGHALTADPSAADCLPLTSCGTPLPDVELRIVDPDGHQALPPGRVGEVWVRGPNVADGYWARPDRDAEVFGARLADGTGPWLRTGDLGFQRDGELFITGRRKDLIIVDGRNHYPDDIEATIMESPAATALGRAAAFAVDSGDDESLVVVAEVHPAKARAGALTVESIERAVRERVAAHHGLATGTVVLTRPGAIPRTSSGKVRRGSCRDLFLSGGLPALDWS